MVRTNLMVLAVLFSMAAGAQAGETARVSDDYALAALRAVIHAQTFGITTDNSPKEWEFVNEADVQANTEAEQKSLEQIERVIFNGWAMNHSGSQVQACYAALKTALKKRDGTTPEACK